VDNVAGALKSPVFLGFSGIGTHVGYARDVSSVTGFTRVSGRAPRTHFLPVRRSAKGADGAHFCKKSRENGLIG